MVDQYADKVVALLHFDGADGSIEFIDETGVIWTPSGAAQLSTARSKFGLASGRFLQTGDSIRAASDARFGFGAGDFTIEGFHFPMANEGDNFTLADFRGSTAGFAVYAALTQAASSIGGGAGLSIYGVAGFIAGSAQKFVIGEWQHWAVSRQGSTLRGFVGGQLMFTAQTADAGETSAPATLFGHYSGLNGQIDQAANGYEDEIRITKGVARYIANFVPPSAPFSLDDNPPQTDAPSLISGTQTLSGIVELAVHPTDDYGVYAVQFELDGAPLGAEISSAPWQIAWDTTAVADGGHVITAVVRDGAGNKTTSAPTQYNVKNNFEAPSTLPQCTITAPANGAVLVGTVGVTAAASDTGGIANVQFKLDGSLLGAALAASPFTVDLDTTTVPDGTHVIKAIATDTDGNTVTDSITVVISNEQPARAPVSIEVRQYREQLRAHLPPGPALADAGQGQLTNLMDGLAYEFSRIDARGAALIDEADPRTTDELLADWERLTGLPDACTPAGQTTAQRRGAVVARLTANNVPSIPALIAQADALGYTVTIVERHARRYRDPLGGLYGGDAWQFTWEVHVQGVAAAPDLECIMRRYAPAHTIVHFIYE